MWLVENMDTHAIETCETSGDVARACGAAVADVEPLLASPCAHVAGCCVRRLDVAEPLATTPSALVRALSACLEEDEGEGARCASPPRVVRLRADADVALARPSPRSAEPAGSPHAIVKPPTFVFSNAAAAAGATPERRPVPRAAAPLRRCKRSFAALAEDLGFEVVSRESPPTVARLEALFDAADDEAEWGGAAKRARGGASRPAPTPVAEVR